MGSFNVGCSMSNISIGAGDEVAFFLLIPNNSEWITNSLTLKPSSALIYPNDYFNLFSFPIFGKYDDYGSICDIKKDKNVELLEHYFKAPINTLMDIVTGRKGIFDRFSSTCKHYLPYYELLDDYNVDLTESFLTAIGFKLEKDIYIHHQCPYAVKLIKQDQEDSTKYSYLFIDLEIDKVVEPSRNYSSCKKRSLLEDIYELTGNVIGIDQETLEKIQLIENLSGMFVEKSIYDALVKNNIDYSYYKEELDNFYEKINRTIQIEKQIQQIDASELLDESLKERLIIEKAFKDPFSSLTSKEVLNLMGPHHFVEKLYKEAFFSGDFEKELFDLFKFYKTAFSCNRFFFPSINGEQFGNYEASKLLLEAALKVCEQKLKRDEYDD